jgi:hypothetical protein
VKQATDLTGKRFGRAVVQAVAERGKAMKWSCICDCGTAFVARGGDLRRGDTKSCGCLKMGVAGRNLRTHGGARSPAWQSWIAMRVRCSPRSKMRKYYFDRGIAICERWKHFANFLADMGPRPAGTTLDRINVNGNYEPDNCRWATAQEQRRNRRDTVLYTYAGKTMCLTDWIREITGDPAKVLKHGAEH